MYGCTRLDFADTARYNNQILASDHDHRTSVSVSGIARSLCSLLRSLADVAWSRGNRKGIRSTERKAVGCSTEWVIDLGCADIAGRICPELCYAVIAVLLDVPCTCISGVRVTLLSVLTVGVRRPWIGKHSETIRVCRGPGQKLRQFCFWNEVLWCFGRQ